MRKTINLSIYSVVIAFALLLGNSVSSYGGIALPSVETGCAKKVNGQFRVWDCDEDADCLPSEYCTVVDGGGDGAPGADGISCWDLNENGDCDATDEDINEDTFCDVLDCKGETGPAGPASCPSIIGGAGLFQKNPNRYLSYFLDKESTSEPPAQMMVGTPGSITNLNVVVTANPVTTATGTYQIDLRVDGVSTALGCNLGIASGCADSDSCVDVDAGDLINLQVDPSDADPDQTPSVNHTAVFNGCACCDGDPPVNGTCVRPD